jgi:hypothetical protein
MRLMQAELFAQLIESGRNQINERRKSGNHQALTTTLISFCCKRSFKI